MIHFHRGAGMLVVLFGILSALIMNVVTIKLFGDSYYQEHSWPKMSVLFLAGIMCLVVGFWLKGKRARSAKREQAYIDSLSPKFETVKQIAFSGPRDHLMFIPVQYWSVLYFLAGVVYGIKNVWVR
jgi:hypothetical protein